MNRALVAGIGLAAVIGAAYVNRLPHGARLLAGETRVLDGDTFVTGAGEHIRLNGIDAPELPGHCRPGRHCVAGDPGLARLDLAYALAFGDVTIQPLKHDRYGRTVAEVTAGHQDVSCYMLRTGNVAYVEQWDEGGRVRAACPEEAR